MNQEVTLATLKIEVDALTLAVERQTKATEDLLAAWNTATNLVKFIKWLSTVVAAFSLIIATLKFGIGSKH